MVNSPDGIYRLEKGGQEIPGGRPLKHNMEECRPCDECGETNWQSAEKSNKFTIVLLRVEP